VALGVPANQALTAVLVYRAISFWLAIAIGWPVYGRRRREPPDLAQPSPQEPNLG
jgi:uncharacterized membrane protein YbhN (UPF0104 family)